jgi:hypothetical protein
MGFFGKGAGFCFARNSEGGMQRAGSEWFFFFFFFETRKGKEGASKQ